MVKNIIIGFGKAGKTLAMELGKRGESTILIEKNPKMYGGTCINVACIPSKKLAELAKNKPADTDSSSYYKSAIQEKKNLIEKLNTGVRRQRFVINSAVVFLLSTIPYKTEWRYKEASHKVIALDAGHIGENLYLACEALGLGTCAIGAYDQDLIDELIEVDGEEEFTIYVFPVGRY